MILSDLRTHRPTSQILKHNIAAFSSIRGRPQLPAPETEHGASGRSPGSLPSTTRHAAAPPPPRTALLTPATSQPPTPHGPSPPPVPVGAALRWQRPRACRTAHAPAADRLTSYTRRGTPPPAGSDVTRWKESAAGGVGGPCLRFCPPASGRGGRTPCRRRWHDDVSSAPDVMRTADRYERCGRADDTRASSAGGIALRGRFSRRVPFPLAGSRPARRMRPV